MEYHKLLSSDVYQGNGWVMNAKGVHKGIAYLIYSHAFPACYVGIHKSCKVFDLIGLRDMDEIYFSSNECTFTGRGDGKHRPQDFLWMGWDYGHLGDFSTYQAELGDTSGHKYSIGELISDIYSAIDNVKDDFKYAFVNGQLRFIPQQGWRTDPIPDDCTVEYISPKFDYGGYDVDVIKDWEKLK